MYSTLFIKIDKILGCYLFLRADIEEKKKNYVRNFKLIINQSEPSV